MIINPKIIEKLKANKIDVDEGLLCLLAVYHKISYSKISFDTLTKLAEVEDTTSITNNLVWEHKLFIDSDKVETPFDWVKDEYIELFERYGKGGFVRESTARMKRLFSENPEIRKEDVLNATRLYLFNTNPKFSRQPHYFIRKGSGVNMTQDILEWIDRAKEVTEATTERDNNRSLI